MTKSDKEGVLQMQPSGRWAICRPGRDPVEVTSGEVFRVEVPSKESLQLTRMEFRHKETVGGVVQLAGYYSVEGYPLRAGLRAAAAGVVSREEWALFHGPAQGRG